MMRIRPWHWAFVATLALAAGCARSTRAPRGPVDTDAAVYLVVLDSLYPAEPDGRMPIVVQPLTARRFGTGWRERLARLTSNDLSATDTGMITRLVAPEPEPRAPRSVLAGRRGLEWIDSARVGTRPTTRPGSPFDIRFGVWLSRIVYSADEQRAMLYESLECGDLCGHGQIVLLRRQSRGDWRIVRTVLDYVS